MSIFKCIVAPQVTAILVGSSCVNLVALPLLLEWKSYYLYGLVVDIIRVYAIKVIVNATSLYG